MKKIKNIEMKIYELLGVKAFRKIAFGFCDILIYPLTIKMTKEERHNFLYNLASNYNLGKNKNLESIKILKKQLFMNARIHILGLLLCLFNFLIGGTPSLFITICNLAFTGINLYCIMLQRYNIIKINQLIKKITPSYEKKKEFIKEDLRKKDSSLNEHTYKIVDKKGKQNSITFEELIANATIEQLMQYREYLTHFQNIVQENLVVFEEKQLNISITTEKDKKLKLEFKRNIH